MNHNINICGHSQSSNRRQNNDIVSRLGHETLALLRTYLQAPRQTPSASRISIMKIEDRGGYRLFILVRRNIIICPDHELHGIRPCRRDRLYGRGEGGFSLQGSHHLQENDLDDIIPGRLTRLIQISRESYARLDVFCATWENSTIFEYVCNQSRYGQGMILAYATSGTIKMCRTPSKLDYVLLLQMQLKYSST